MKRDFRKLLLAVPEWVKGRDDGQFAREVTDGVTDLYRAGYTYGALEREMVLTQLTILFMSTPGLLNRELERLGGIKPSVEEMNKGIEYLLETHLGLLWPEASRRG